MPRICATPARHSHSHSWTVLHYVQHLRLFLLPPCYIRMVGLPTRDCYPHRLPKRACTRTATCCISRCHFALCRINARVRLATPPAARARAAARAAPHLPRATPAACCLRCHLCRSPCHAAPQRACTAVRYCRCGIPHCASAATPAALRRAATRASLRLPRTCCCRAAWRTTARMPAACHCRAYACTLHFAPATACHASTAASPACYTILRTLYVIMSDSHASHLIPWMWVGAVLPSCLCAVCYSLPYAWRCPGCSRWFATRTGTVTRTHALPIRSGSGRCRSSIGAKR